MRAPGMLYNSRFLHFPLFIQDGEGSDYILKLAPVIFSDSSHKSAAASRL